MVQQNVVSNAFSCSLKLFIFLACVDDNEELSKEALFDLSQSIVKKSHLRTLGIKGLHIANEKIEKQLRNNENDVTSAAYELLLEWRNALPNARIALKIICEALCRTEMKYLIEHCKVSKS